jgi:hypothetical protein
VGRPALDGARGDAALKEAFDWWLSAANWLYDNPDLSNCGVENATGAT